MIRSLVSAALCAALAFPAAAQQPVLPQPAAIQATRAALVNGKPIPRSRVDLLVKQQVAQGAPDGEQLRKAITEELINRELVVQDAERKGLTKSADLREQLELARQQVIVNAYMQDHFRGKPVSDATLRAEYERLKAQRGDKEYKARHVLVESEAEAKDILAQLDKGAKFDELAKRSKDIGSRDKGGELGWAAPATYVKPFADALVKLEKGKHTAQPVQSQFGWHVIQLDDVRATQFPAYEQAKPQLQAMLQQQEVHKVVSDLRARAKIE